MIEHMIEHRCSIIDVRQQKRPTNNKRDQQTTKGTKQQKRPTKMLGHTSIDTCSLMFELDHPCSSIRSIIFFRATEKGVVLCMDICLMYTSMMHMYKHATTHTHAHTPKDMVVFCIHIYNYIYVCRQTCQSYVYIHVTYMCKYAPTHIHTHICAHVCVRVCV